MRLLKVIAFGTVTGGTGIKGNFHSPVYTFLCCLHIKNIKNVYNVGERKTEVDYH